jgi:hypothetical protein
MRVKSLVILAVIIGAVAYVLIFKQEWLWEAKRVASGYTAATTPSEAAERFRKATHARDYKSAAVYCTQEYADLLKRAADRCDEIGTVIDGITEYMTNKGLATDKSILMLNFLDPFPKIKLRGEPKKKDENTYWVHFDMEPLGLSGNLHALQASDLTSVDGKMFGRVLVPAAIALNTEIPIVKEGDVWKLKVGVLPAQTQAVEYYLARVKSYHTALSKFRGEVTNERYGSKGDFERELMRVLADSK